MNGIGSLYITNLMNMQKILSSVIIVVNQIVLLMDGIQMVETQDFLYGSKDKIRFSMTSKSGHHHDKESFFEGIINSFNRRYMETQSEWIREWIEGFMVEKECSLCHGARMNEKVLNVLIMKHLN